MTGKCPTGTWLWHSDGLLLPFLFSRSLQSSEGRIAGKEMQQFVTGAVTMDTDCFSVLPATLRAPLEQGHVILCPRHLAQCPTHTLAAPYKFQSMKWEWLLPLSDPGLITVRANAQHCLFFF